MKLLGIAAVLVVLLGCGKSDKKESGGAGGASTDPKVTVKGFIEAMAAGDLDKARTYLPGDDICKKAPSGQEAHCLAEMKKQRDALEGLKDEWPKGATVKSVEPSGEAGLPPGMGEWKVVIVADGKEQETGAMTVEMDGKHYAAFAMRAD